MNILITGALGFLGLNLTRVLASQGSIHVIAADVRQPTPEQEHLLKPATTRITFCTVDVMDRQAIHELLHLKQVSHIVHAAAITPTLAHEQKNPTQVVDINLGGTINLLDAAVQTSSIQRVIIASSSGVYGASEKTVGATQHEAGPLALDELYSITKRSAELLTQRYSELSGISMATVRLAALYGPVERPSASRPNISAVGQLMEALSRDKPITVAGPSVQRDWTYMEDAANAMLALLRAEQLKHAVYNVGCGTSVSWRQVVEAFVGHGLAATWCEDAAIADIGMSPGQERLVMDISRLQSDTDFVPQYGIEEGVAGYVEAESQSRALGHREE